MSRPNEKKGAKRLIKKEPKAKKTPKYEGKQLIIYRCYLALVIISALIVAGYVIFHLFSAPPDPPGGGDNPVNTRPPQTTTTVDPETGEEIVIEIPGLPEDRKEQFYTFLVVGQSQDEGGKLCDTMMLVAYDVPQQKLSVMNLPRDTYVRYRGDAVLLNSIFNRGGGIEALKKEVQELTGIYPDYHVIIQWEALGELVDAIGGVYFEVPFDMYYNDLSQHFKIDLKKGYQLLDGEGAMGVVRWRKNSIGDTGREDHSYGYREGDLGRIKTQQAFMKAVLAKCLQPEVLLPNLAGYINIFQKNVETDLSVPNMAYFGKSAIGGLDMDNVEFITLPNTSAGNGHLLPVGGEIVKTVNEHFNPYETAIRRGELDLVDISAIVTPTPEPEESEEPEPSETPDPEDSESPEPTESDDVILPPGTITRPSASPRPSESGKPTGSSRPSESPKPEESGQPSAPPASEAPASTPEPTPEPPAEPETPPPATPAPAEDDPILPPGV